MSWSRSGIPEETRLFLVLDTDFLLNVFPPDRSLENSQCPANQLIVHAKGYSFSLPTNLANPSGLINVFPKPYAFRPPFSRKIQIRSS